MFQKSFCDEPSSTYGFLKPKPPELCLLMNTLLHHNPCCLWEGGMVLSPSVTWPLLFPWQPGVPLWIEQSLQWRLCPCPASGCSAAPPAGPSVACGPVLRDEALWGLAVRRLSPGTPSWRRSACTQGATTAAAATAWSSLFWETITGRVFPPGIFQNLSINQKDTHMQHWDSGDRMEISSLECFPNLGGKYDEDGRKPTKQNFSARKIIGISSSMVRRLTLWHYPSAEGILPHRIWKRLHNDVCPCYLWEQEGSQRWFWLWKRRCWFKWWLKVITYWWGSRRSTCRWCWAACFLSYMDTSASQCHRKRDSLPTCNRNEKF